MPATTYAAQVWRGRPRPRTPTRTDPQCSSVTDYTQTIPPCLELDVRHIGSTREISLPPAPSAFAEGRRRSLRDILRRRAFNPAFCRTPSVLEHCLREGGLWPFAGEGARATPRIRLHAVVIMPDHVHLLLQPLRDTSGRPHPLVDILQCMKSATAHRINKLLHHSGPVWEEESFDHVLRSDESLKQKAEYIRQNPVRRGLVERPEDYKWLWIDPELLNVARAPSPA